MKTLNKIFVLLSLITLIGINNVDAQCSASFTFADSGNGYALFTSTSTGNNLTYVWNFGDGGTNIYNSIVTHHYASNGTYNVSLQIMDGASNCIDSTYQTITIASITCFLASTFTYTDNGNANYTFNPTSTGGTAPYTYSWDFQDGSSSTLQNPTHTYTMNGYYFPHVWVADANGCGSQAYTSLLVTGGTPCNTTAGFTYLDNGNGNYTFTNTSTGSTWSNWNFGNGSSNSNSTTVTNTYTTNGTYTVYLTIGDSNNNCMDTLYQTITVNSVTPCNVTAGFTFVDNGNGNYTFTNTSTGSNWSYWGFGNGSSNSNNITVTNTYLTNGTYTIYLIVGDSNNNCMDTLYQTITVNSVTPCNVTVGFTYVDNGNGNYSFTSNISGGTAPYTYNWWFSGTGSSLANPSHTFTNGQYNPTLSVTDANGCTAWYGDTINVNNCNYTFTVYDSLGYTYFETNGTNGWSNGSSYFWDFGDGTTYSSSIWSSYSHTYSSPGTYYYCITIDSCPPICDSIIVSYNNTPCNLAANFTYTDNGNGNYSFNNTSTGNVASFYWNFGDGNNSTLSTPTHAFTSNATFVVQLIVNDSSGFCSDITNITIQVSGVPNPIACNAAFVIYPDSANNGNVIVFNTSTGNNLSYFWSFGDGSTSTQQFPSYTYTSSGPFNLCLTVTDSLNGGTCSSTYCDSIDSGGLVFKGGGFTISVVPPTSTNINSTPNLVAGLNIYPNPFKDNLTIELNLLEKTPISIFVTDILGKRITDINTTDLSVGENRIIWNPETLANGIYLLNIKTNNSLQVEKLILNK